MPDDRPLEGVRVLLVEDDPLLGLYLGEALREVGATVTGPVTTAECAESAANRNGIDVAVVDLFLGARTTLAAAELLRRRGVPFAFSTGRPEHEGLRAFPDVPVLTKPVDAGRIVATLVRLMPKRRS